VPRNELHEMYGPPRDCKGKDKAMDRSAQNVFGPVGSATARGHDELRPFSGAGCEHAVGNCSFVLAIRCRSWWRTSSRRRGAGKLERDPRFQAEGVFSVPSQAAKAFTGAR
jgi:hypothetical protein